MKRALVVLPLLALVVGVLVFALRKAPGEAPSPAPPVRTDPHHHSSEPGSAAPTKTAPPAAPTAAALPKGALRLQVLFQGRPAAKASVRVMQGGTAQDIRFETEADGTQWLRALPPGEYTVSIGYEDCVPHHQDVQIRAGETLPVIVELRRGGRIEGTVSDKGGTPLREVSIILLSADGRETLMQTEVQSDAQGRYALKGIPQGAYGIRFRHPQYKPLERLGLVLRNPGDELRIDAVLEVGARIRGRVVDEQDRPIAGADIMGGNLESGGLTKSAEDGSFELGGLTDQTPSLSAAKKGYARVFLRNLPTNSSDVVFKLPRAGTAIGRVVIDPIPRQFQVTLSRFDETIGQVTIASSKFFVDSPMGGWMIDDLAPGTYWVEVRAEGLEPVDRPQVLVSSGNVAAEISITLRKIK